MKRVNPQDLVRRRMMARPATPKASSAIEPGSGTSFGGRELLIAEASILT